MLVLKVLVEGVGRGCWSRVLLSVLVKGADFEGVEKAVG